ncbi:MAG: hypothetical protein V4622_08575 [Bacteroidota bacterium]
MKPPFEIIEFSFAGLTLQEPMALVFNWAITVFSLYAFFSIRWSDSYSSKQFKNFYLCLAISTFLSGFGHVLFQYFGIFGKYPAWILAVTSGYFISQGILYYYRNHKSYLLLKYFLIIKSVILLTLSLINKTFLFIAIDSILTYLLYCGYLTGRLWAKNNLDMQYFVYGILVLIPSAFIFLLNINLHRYLNRDDLSHVLMLICIILFYYGVKKMNMRYLKADTLNKV